jgi:hypothetical protein
LGDFRYLCEHAMIRTDIYTDLKSWHDSKDGTRDKFFAQLQLFEQTESFT